MSASAALQIAIVEALKADAGVSAFLGDRIYDNAPGTEYFPYLTLGPAQEIDDSAECVDGAECFQQIDVWTMEGGSKLTAKQICGAVKLALHGAEIELEDPFALVLIEIEDWRVTGDPDEKIAHGIVNVRALVERVT